MNTRSVVGGAALVFGDTLSVSYGVAYDKFRYNDRNRLITTTVNCGDTRHCVDRGGDTYEYITQKYAGWSAALNLGPVALKGTQNHVRGKSVKNIYAEGDNHTEFNLSIAF